MKNRIWHLAALIFLTASLQQTFAEDKSRICYLKINESEFPYEVRLHGPQMIDYTLKLGINEIHKNLKTCDARLITIKNKRQGVLHFHYLEAMTKKIKLQFGPAFRSKMQQQQNFIST